MSDLANQTCEPCRGGVPPMEPAQQEELLGMLSDGWSVIAQHHLQKEWRFDNFAQALAFVNRVGALAEDMGHHPDISFTWGYCKIEIWTHKIDGLHIADFVLAARIDETAA